MATEMDRQHKLARLGAIGWHEIEDWAGTAVAARGRSYQRGGRVTQPAQTPDGAVVAWVQGTERYATLVDFGEHGLIGACSCPYGVGCKHSVALLLELQAQLQRQRAIPHASLGDPRIALLDAGDAWDAGEWEPGAVPRRPHDPTLRAFLEQQTPAQLIDLIADLAARFPELNAALDERRKLETGTPAQLVEESRELIAKAASEQDWDDEWYDEASSVDYGPLHQRLALLFQQGHYDDIVGLGDALLDSGIEQVERSHDEGETMAEVAGCMNIVFRALARSSLEPSAQLLWAVDANLRDQYELTAGADAVVEQLHSSAD